MVLVVVVVDLVGVAAALNANVLQAVEVGDGTVVGVAPRFGAFGSVVGGSVVVFVEGLVMLGLCHLV